MKRTLVVLMLALAACGSQPSAQQAQSTTLTWAIETQPITLNPQQWAQNKVRLLVFNQFDALLSRGRDGSFQPWLAKSWKVSADGLSYTFELRDDVSFHDGTTFDAAAVKANLEQFLVPGYNAAVAAIQLAAFDRGRGGVAHHGEGHAQEARRAVPRLPGLAVRRAGLARVAEGGQEPPVRRPRPGGHRPVHPRPATFRARSSTTPQPRLPVGAASAGHQGPADLSDITYRFLPEAAVGVGALTSGQVQVIEGVPATDVSLIKKEHFHFQTALNSGTPSSLLLQRLTPPLRRPARTAGLPRGRGRRRRPRPLH